MIRIIFILNFLFSLLQFLMLNVALKISCEICNERICENPLRSYLSSQHSFTFCPDIKEQSNVINLDLFYMWDSTCHERGNN